MTLYHCGRSRVGAGVRFTSKRGQFGRRPKADYGLNSTGSESRQEKNIFSFLRDVLTGSGSSPAGVLSTGEKRPGREFHHSPTLSAESKTEWPHTSTLPIRLHRVPRDTFTFTADNSTRYITVSWTHTKNAFIDSRKDPVSCSDCTLLKSTMLDAQSFRLQPVPHREHRRSSYYMCLVVSDIN